MTTPPITIERLERVQSTLVRRVSQRDPENIVAVGFAPAGSGDARAASPPADLPIKAQFDVLRKRKQVAAERRIESLEAVRLLDRSSRHYDHLELETDVMQAGSVVPTGVRISSGPRRATTSLIVRWATRYPLPALPTADELSDAPDWRWGVLTVSHLFAGSSQDDSNVATPPASVRRLASCELGPESIGGRVVARGRMPGGPDLALVETGLDRLWLSGFLPHVAMEPISPAGESELLRWISQGTQGSLIGSEDTSHAWMWRTFYPHLNIEGLGRLKGIVRYEYASAPQLAVGPQGSASVRQPFGPGSSGSVLLAGGIPIGLQIAATQPDYRIGYAQTFWASLPWLKNSLRASALAIVHVVT